ncbi:venom serine protease 34-like isoform X2 [Leptopilina heterotoma]|uniref:venom serine protease 34-like isoform X2 n=1 Tax=Leptopilina heterotoma TaxID=63436 RepID=UPI001CAA3EA8|nr:venom serine protease 34-like isoform X2 [Leptopilina heterotoma]
MLNQQGSRNCYNSGISSKIFYFLFIFLFLLDVSKTQEADCDLYQFVNLGSLYYIYNLEYPDYVTGTKYCRFRAEAPEGYRILLECEDINIPSSLLCLNQYLSINTNPDSILSIPSIFCGIGTMTMSSVNNKMTVIYRSLPTGRPARFFCNVTSVA